MACTKQPQYPRSYEAMAYLARPWSVRGKAEASGAVHVSGYKNSRVLTKIDNYWRGGKNCINGLYIRTGKVDPKSEIRKITLP
jgi:hypothetical protein